MPGGSGEELASTILDRPSSCATDPSTCICLYPRRRQSMFPEPCRWPALSVECYGMKAYKECRGIEAVGA